MSKMTCPCGGMLSSQVLETAEGERLDVARCPKCRRAWSEDGRTWWIDHDLKWPRQLVARTEED